MINSGLCDGAQAFHMNVYHLGAPLSSCLKTDLFKQKKWSCSKYKNTLCGRKPRNWKEIILVQHSRTLKREVWKKW